MYVRNYIYRVVRKNTLQLVTSFDEHFSNYPIYLFHSILFFHKVPVILR